MLGLVEGLENLNGCPDSYYDYGMKKETKKGGKKKKNISKMIGKKKVGFTNELRGEKISIKRESVN
jgi:hypothetical protein